MKSKNVNPDHNRSAPQPTGCNHDPKYSGYCMACLHRALIHRKVHPEKYVDRGRER
jgi:hypothetical protein